MDKKLLQKTFREWKKIAKADYSITNPSSLGDCMSCVNYELCEKYGEESKGIWAKVWTYGMNGGPGVEKLDSVYVAHDITEEQADAFYKVFGEHYNILPRSYDPYKCFELFQKDTCVWEVSYHHKLSDEYTIVDENGDPIVYRDTYTYRNKAYARAYTLETEYGCEDVRVEQIF